MKDFNAIFKTYFGKTRTKLGLKTELGSKFILGGYEKNFSWYYERMFFGKLLILKKLNDYLKNKKISSVLEIGCSTGLLPKSMDEIFNNIRNNLIKIRGRSLFLSYRWFNLYSFKVISRSNH